MLASAIIAIITIRSGSCILALISSESLSFLIEFLAASPSIAYGVWGVLVLGPFLQTNVEPGLNSVFLNSPRIPWYVQGTWTKAPCLGFLGTDSSPSGPVCSAPV